MRNLNIVNKAITVPDYNSPSLFCAADHSSLVAIDRTNDDVQNARRVIKVCSGQNSVQEVHTFSEQELELLHPLDKSVQVSYTSLTDTLSLATNTGGFYQFGLSSGILEELFIAPSGISAFAVSPDSRLLVVATKEETITLFTLPDLELLTTAELGPQRPDGASDDLYEVCIQWRWDSHYFAVNFYDGATRRIQVYDETGKQYSKSEDGVKISSKCLAWQPSGGLIGTLGTSPSSNPNVTFFELNGLKRADFDPFERRSVDDEKLPVKDILWNYNSDVLALRKENCVELWTRSNYAWMCKKTIYPEKVSSGDDSKVLSILHASWDVEVPYRFHMVASDGTYAVYDLVFSFSKGNSQGSAIAASVNGPTFYCTAFRDTCAPPPTCRFQQTLSRNIQEIVIANFWDGLAAIQTSGEISFFKNSKTSLEKIANAICKGADLDIRACYNWIWPNKTQLACISRGNLLVFEISKPEFLDNSLSKDVVELTLELKSNVSVRAKLIEPLFVTNNSETKNVLVQKRCGSLLLQELTVMPNILLGRLPNSVHHLSYLTTTNEISEHNLIVLGLDPVTKQLHSLHKSAPLKLLNDCISITTFENYLLATTTQGSLDVIESKEIEACHKNNVNSTEALVKYTRKVEKGSVILICCLNRILEPSLTLQIIPRGNLETVSPRPLMITSIDVLLKNRKYNEVMVAMRRHRLDFNVLANQIKNLATRESASESAYNELLTSILGSFLEDVKDSHTVVLMVTELSELHGDCVLLLKNILQEKLSTDSESSNKDRLVHPYLAVMAKLGLFEEVLRSHLIVINDLNRELVKSRIKFLGFYCENPEILYESALGTYDLNLTSLVADCLNKDPKEYLPILNEYQTLSSTKLKFTIDQKLKRYEKAVISLLQLPDSSMEDVIKYIERYKVHPVAIKYLTDTLAINDNVQPNIKGFLEQVYCSYGSVFEELKKFPEAAVCYSRGNNNEKAFDAFAKAGNWNAALCCISAVQGSDRNELLSKLVKSLQDLKDYEAAGDILKNQLEDSDGAFRAYVKGRKWQRAGHIAETDSLKAEYAHELEEVGSTLQDICSGIQAEISKYVARLKVVKALKEQRAVDGFENDNFSDTESISTTTSIRSGISSSMHSGKTSRSGKNSRKMQRKLYSLKEGSQFEDIAIIAHLWETCQRVQVEIKPDVESILPALWMEGKDERAGQLIRAFEQLIQVASDCVKEIWPTVLPPNEFLEMKYFVAPPGWTSSWKKCLILT